MNITFLGKFDKNDDVPLSRGVPAPCGRDEEDKLAKQKGGRIVRLMEGDVVGMTLFQYEDILFSAFVLKYLDIAQTLKSIKQLEHRPDDVLLCTYPKSEHVTNGGKIILTLRNPKDVIVSMYYHGIKDVTILSKLSWASFLKCNMTGDMIMGSYLDYLRHWDHVIRTNKKLNVLVIYYESLIKNPSDNVRQIRDFLGLEMDDVRVHDVIARCCLDKLRDDANSRKPQFMSLDEANKTIIYRKGAIGDWMSHFTVAQNEEFDELIRDKLSDTMFRFDFYPPKSNSSV